MRLLRLPSLELILLVSIGSAGGGGTDGSFGVAVIVERRFAVLAAVSLSLSLLDFLLSLLSASSILIVGGSFLFERLLTPSR